ncbi:hypothetical protein [Pedobacter ureilyticus]|uniref:SMI1/KNR4 family protein n=1 Tax=Pedobacter ureilyticus TaxID=1393051 RepID=A0ABW9J9A4_9SPHI|nr:hypothetical protein [Pedobacter helvus]
MEIRYLKSLRDNPAAFYDNTEFRDEIKPISLAEISELETLYNNGLAFPIALKELLFLAGDNCYVLDYGSETQSQNDLQEWVREKMLEYDRIIARPFYVLDIYNALDQFVFIYLDEGDDPSVYEGVYSGINETGIQTTDGWIHKLRPNLSDYIKTSVENVCKGQNPF